MDIKDKYYKETNKSWLQNTNSHVSNYPSWQYVEYLETMVKHFLAKESKPTEQTSEVKTAEATLEEYGCPEIPFDENITMPYPAIIEAMHEYHNQFKTK